MSLLLNYDPQSNQLSKVTDFTINNMRNSDAEFVHKVTEIIFGPNNLPSLESLDSFTLVDKMREEYKDGVGMPLYPSLEHCNLAECLAKSDQLTEIMDITDVYNIDEIHSSLEGEFIKKVMRLGFKGVKVLAKIITKLLELYFRFMGTTLQSIASGFSSVASLIDQSRVLMGFKEVDVVDDIETSIEDLEKNKLFKEKEDVRKLLESTLSVDFKKDDEVDALKRMARTIFPGDPFKGTTKEYITKLVRPSKETGETTTISPSRYLAILKRVDRLDKGSNRITGHVKRVKKKYEDFKKDLKKLEGEEEKEYSKNLEVLKKIIELCVMSDKLVLEAESAILKKLKMAENFRPRNTNTNRKKIKFGDNNEE